MVSRLEAGMRVPVSANTAKINGFSLGQPLKHLDPKAVFLTYKKPY
jgi:hypothetical protein